jgi:hypothetical protein
LPSASTTCASWQTGPVGISRSESVSTSSAGTDSPTHGRSPSECSKPCRTT